MRLITTLIAIILVALPAIAEPVRYRVDAANSELSFAYKFGDRTITGRFPDFATDLVIDFENVANSRVSVSANTQKVRGGFPFATGVLKGPSMLHSDKFPKITFQSNRVKGGGNSAEIIGKISVRGVTKPQNLTAKLFRPKDSAPNDFSDLRMKISGKLNRHDFNASAFPDEVGPTLTILVDARIIAE